MPLGVNSSIDGSSLLHITASILNLEGNLRIDVVGYSGEEMRTRKEGLTTRKKGNQERAEDIGREVGEIFLNLGGVFENQKEDR